MKKGIFENLGLKLFSFIFALVLWFVVSGKGTTYTEISYTLPLEFKSVPANLVVTNDFEDKIEVRLSGPTTLLNSVRSEKLKYTIDLADIQPGESSFSIDPENIALLRGLKITKISPSKITLVLERVIKKVVPLELNIVGELPEGYVITSKLIDPAEVAIKGAESEIDAINSLSTVEIDVSNATGMIDRDLDIIFKDIFYSEIIDKKVISAKIEIVEKMIEKEFKDVVPEIRGVEGEAYSITPKKLAVIVSGPYSIVNDLQPESINVFISAEDVAGTPIFKHPSIELPQGVTIQSLNPESIKVTKVTTKNIRRKK